MLPASFYIAYGLILDVIINAAIADEGAAAVCMARHGTDDVRILYLLVEVAHEGAPRQMGSRQIAEPPTLFLSREGVVDGHVSRDSHCLKNLLQVLLIDIDRELIEVEERATGVALVLVAVEDGTRLVNKRHTHGAHALSDGFLWNILQIVANDIITRERAKVADATTDKTLEDKGVALHLVLCPERTLREDNIEEPVAFLYRQIIRRAINGTVDFHPHI